MLDINDGLKAIAYALLALFFVIGVVKTCGSLTELKKPELAVKCFVRFVLAQAAVESGMELLTLLFSVAQDAIASIMRSSGLAAVSTAVLPDEMVDIIEEVSFIDSIPV